MGIYKSIQKPIIGLSPMEDVTDSVFRQVIKSLGKIDLMYTEFVNFDGLNSVGRDNVIHRLQYAEEEKPIIAQLWGNTPENFMKSSKIVFEKGFDGVDINMGCSVKSVVKEYAGSGLINADRVLVKEIISSVKIGCNGLPVSVKTRLGFNSVDLEWIEFLLEQGLDALAIHMRTARGKDSIIANWEYMSEIVELRNKISPNTLILGNGDIKSLTEAKEMLSKYNLDGVLIGRAAISNPWIFSGRENIPREEKIMTFKKHLKLFDRTWHGTKNFSSLKKFFRSYINDFDGASELRQKLMLCNNGEDVLRILDATNSF